MLSLPLNREDPAPLLGPGPILHPSSRCILLDELHLSVLEANEMKQGKNSSSNNGQDNWHGYDSLPQARSGGELTLRVVRARRVEGLSAVLVVLLIGCLHAVLGATDEDFSVVVLPDTQIYAWKYPELFHAQTRWIAESRAKYNIEYVLHVGDVVEHNNEKEWKIAREAFSLLDGKVPYAIALGNHDIGPKGILENPGYPFWRVLPA